MSHVPLDQEPSLLGLCRQKILRDVGHCLGSFLVEGRLEAAEYPIHSWLQKRWADKHRDTCCAMRCWVWELADVIQVLANGGPDVEWPVVEAKFMALDLSEFHGPSLCAPCCTASSEVNVCRELMMVRSYRYLPDQYGHSNSVYCVHLVCSALLPLFATTANSRQHSACPSTAYESQPSSSLITGSHCTFCSASSCHRSPCLLSSGRSSPCSSTIGIWPSASGISAQQTCELPFTVQRCKRQDAAISPSSGRVALSHLSSTTSMSSGSPVKDDKVLAMIAPHETSMEG